MGSLFQQGRVRLNIGGTKYQRLEDTDPWIGLDDDEDDELINANENPSLRNNHETSNGRTGISDGQFEELTIDVGNEDDRFLYDRRMLERQGSPLYKTFTAKRDAQCRNRRRLLCALIAGFISILVVCLIYALLPCAPSSSPGSNPSLMGGSRDFAINITGATETTVRLYDVNNDGVKDIIFGYGRLMQKLNGTDMDDFCVFLNMTAPCAGAVRAVDGRDGALLWELNVKCEVYAILCDKLDANGDGVKDCLIAGRLGVLQAVDSTNGDSIWTPDPTVTNSMWNFYQPQVVPDLDGDGVPDVVVSHGGNGDYGPKETHRDANRLLLLSGKTGKSLGGFLETPDHMETYSAITLYEKKDGAIFVFFGTGGETVKGSLWMISLWDLYCHVKGHGAQCLQASRVPTLQNGDYRKEWGKSTTSTSAGVKEILRSGSNKGMMVPTVLADLNQDGILDLIVSVFNGTVAVLDGIDFSIIWTTGDRFGEYETYSTPAPGHFNSDDVPDVMVRLSHGNWSAHYNSTKMFIFDGRDGQILWSTESHSQEPVMTSPLSVRGRDNRDSFVFWVQGRQTTGMESTPTTSHLGQGQITGRPKDGKNDKRNRRHSDKEVTSDCDKPTAMFECELFLMNRNIAWTPLRILSTEPYKYYYNVFDEKAATFVPKSQQDPYKRHRRNHDSPSNPPSPNTLSDLLPQQQSTQTHTHHSTTSPNTHSSEAPNPIAGDAMVEEPVSVGQPPYLVDNNVTSGATPPTTKQTAAATPPTTKQTAAATPPTTKQTAAATPPTTKQTAAATPPTTKHTAAATPPTTKQTAAPIFNPIPSTHILSSTIAADPVYQKTTSSKQQTMPFFHGDPNFIYTDNVDDHINRDQESDYFGHGKGHAVDDEDEDLCAIVSSWARSTGAVGDMDNDGMLDIVYIINYMTPIKDAEGGYITAKSSLTLIKTSLIDAPDQYITLDQKRTFCDPSIESREGEDFDFMLKGESKWMGYVGTEGDCRYD